MSGPDEQDAANGAGRRLLVHRIEIVADSAGVVSQALIDADAFEVPEGCTLARAAALVACHAERARLAIASSR